MDPDDREFMRELTRRHEQATRAMIARLDAGTRRLDELTAEFVAHRADFLAESRAQRAALFRILDRLDEGGSAAGA